MQVKVLARHPVDGFTFNFFRKCFQRLPANSDAFYFWAEKLPDLRSLLQELSISNPNVLICISGKLSYNDFNPWTSCLTDGVYALKELFDLYPDKNFILISDLVNLDQEFKDVKNLQIVSLDYVTMLAEEWQEVPCQLDKNFASTQHFISLNHRAAIHRISSLSYMLSTGLCVHGNILASSGFVNHVKQYQCYLDMTGWEFDSDQEQNLKPILLNGFSMIQGLDNINNDYLEQAANSFAYNYTQYLTPLYKNSFVEIVAETYYAEPSIIVTEKTLNAIYGCNFPIYLGAAGTVQHLENLGFDMFRDVVNHSYDLVSNPFSRLERMFEDNIQLLTDSNYAKSMWTKNIDRFKNNAAYARKEMYDTVNSRALSDFDRAIAQLQQ